MLYKVGASSVWASVSLGTQCRSPQGRTNTHVASPPSESPQTLEKTAQYALAHISSIKGGIGLAIAHQYSKVNQQLKPENLHSN